MRYELYHYCIEEGHNIPDMTCLQSANLRYRGAVPLSHSLKGHGVGLWSLESNLGWKHQHPGLLEHGCREWNLGCFQSGATSALSALEESQEGSRTPP